MKRRNRSALMQGTWHTGKPQKGQMRRKAMGAYLRHIGLVALAVCALGWLIARPARVSAGGTPISLTAYGTAVTENFDTLATSGTANTTVPTGWGFVETGSNANTTYAAEAGAGAAGNTYSYGTGTNTDRALGELTSANLISILGSCYINNTGGNIGVLYITYTGEQWRSGDTTNVPDFLTFEYSLNATGLNDGAATWVAVTALDFTGPITTAATGALDGNVTANRTAKAVGIDNLTIPNGTTFYLRWRSTNIAGNDDGLAIDDFSLTPYGPTLAKVEKFAAYSLPEGNAVRWQSSFESKNLGFHVYREAGASRIRLTPDVVAGSMLKYGAAALLSGDNYAWWDKDGTPESVYWIEDIDAEGRTAWHGPVRVGVADKETARQLGEASSAVLSQLRPNAPNSAQLRQVLPPAVAALAARQIAPATEAAQRQINLANRAAIKLDVRRTGWYRVTAQQLYAAGLAPVADAALLQLYADGVQVPLAVRSASGASQLQAGDALEFFGVGLDTRESATRTYWLIAGAERGLRIGQAAKVAPGPQIDPENGAASARVPDKGKSAASISQRPIEPAARQNFAYTVERADRAFYAPAIPNGAAENFYAAAVGAAAVTQTLHIKHLDVTASQLARLEIALQGATEGVHNIRVALNGQDLSTVTLPGLDRMTVRLEVPQSMLREGDNSITLRATGGASDISLLEYVRVRYAHRWTADDDQLLFETGRRNGLTVDGFSSANIRVYDVTEPQRQFELATRINSDAAGYNASITSALENRTLLAVNENQYLMPDSVTLNAASNWMSANQAWDFVILTPDAWRGTVAPLAAARQGQGLRTAVISLQDIYDEGNGGTPSAQAVREFLKWTRTNWQTAPRYVLLVGDATFDPRNYLGFSAAGTFAPTMWVDTVSFETASDETLVDFDGDGVGEMSVGRLPAQSASELQTMIAKTLAFTPSNRDAALLVADQPEGYDFAGLNQNTREQLPAEMPVTVINRADYSVAHPARTQIVQAINDGATLVQYAGHGSVQTWTSASMLANSDVAAMNNATHPAFFSLMTCLNGYFFDNQAESLSEALLRAPNGGAAAVWASTGLTVAGGQSVMNREMFRHLYGASGVVRLGDAISAAKTATTDREVRRTWVLFGDPTLRLH